MTDNSGFTDSSECTSHTSTTSTSRSHDLHTTRSSLQGACSPTSSISDFANSEVMSHLPVTPECVRPTATLFEWVYIGVALYGPFQYPEGLRPVSPVFWLCVHYFVLWSQSVTIPHFLHLENHDDIESLRLTFLKGDHEMNPQQMYHFQQADGDALLEPLKDHGALQTTHLCYMCISSKKPLN